jgi:hypothetical protein
MLAGERMTNFLTRQAAQFALAQFADLGLPNAAHFYVTRVSQ